MDCFCFVVENQVFLLTVLIELFVIKINLVELKMNINSNKEQSLILSKVIKKKINASRIEAK